MLLLYLLQELVRVNVDWFFFEISSVVKPVNVETTSIGELCSSAMPLSPKNERNSKNR